MNEGIFIELNKDKKEWKTVMESYGKASLGKFSDISLRKGDKIKITTPGGGGWGEGAGCITQGKDRDTGDGDPAVAPGHGLYPLPLLRGGSQ